MFLEPFLLIISYILKLKFIYHGHTREFSNLQNFTQQFLKGKSSFLTKMLNDQSTNNRLMNQHQIKKIILVLLNNQQTITQPQQKTFRSMRSNNILHQMRYQKEPLIHTTINTRELDKGRGTRTTSKKSYQSCYRLLCALIVH
jgi:hypothetical protein